MDNDGPPEESQGEVEIMEHTHHGPALAGVQVAQQVKQGKLMLDVQPGQRLVEQEVLGVLCQQRREAHALSLATREILHTTGHEVRDFTCRNSTTHSIRVGASPTGQE